MKHLDIRKDIAELAFYATEPLAREPLVRRRVQAELEKKFLAHARKAALAKVGRRPEPVPLDGEVNVRARASIAKTLTKALGKVKKQAVALVKQQGELKKVWGPAAWEASAEARARRAEVHGILPMDQASRYTRAREQGFDTGKVWYHGSAHEFSEFKAGTGGLVGSNTPVVWLTENPDAADIFARGRLGDAPQVYPLFVRGRLASDKDYDNMKSKTSNKDVLSELKRAGFSGAHAGSGVVVVFDPKNIRSVHAAFDPHFKEAADLGKAADDKDLPSKIAKELDLSEVVYAAITTGDDLSEAAVMAAQHTLKTLALGDDEKLTDLVNEKAVNIARKQAAMLVGRHYDEDGNLVESANPEYQIDETTRDGIRKIISDGLADNAGTDQIAKNINESFIVSEKRAALIARSEVARANSLSVLDSLFTARDDAGVNLKKAWLTAGDDLVDEVCQENEDAGPIDLEDDFPSGDDAPTAHPFCRCVLTTVVLDDDADAEKGM
jgi:Phage Mu protein F like protein